MKVRMLEGRIALLGWGAALMAGGLVLSFFPADVTTGFSCQIDDEIFCFPTNAMVPSPYHALGIIAVAASLALLLCAALRRAPV